MSDRLKAAQATARRTCGSLRAARCLIDALIADEPVEIAQSGRSWVVRSPGARVPLVRRKSRENAEAAVEAAREVIGLVYPSACPVPAPCPEPTPCDRPLTPEILEERRRTRVVTPQRPQGESARYKVVDATQLVPSHNPRTFDPDPRYPPNVQEREYHRDRNEQMKVSLGAQNLDPSFLLNNVPTAMDGPPLVTEGPPFLALGGNGRSMMILRAYDDGPAGDLYRAALLERSIDFGLEPDVVDAFERPVLVRVVEGLRASSPSADLALAVRRYNEGLTQALSPRARAVSEARTMSLATLEALGEVIGSVGEDASLREVMRDRPRDLLAVLERDGIVTPQNRSTWATATGFTDEGKDKLEGLFLGRVIGSGDRLNATAPNLLRKLERAVPYLVRVAGLNPDLDLIPDVQDAVDLLNTAGSFNPPLKLDEYLAQGNLFGSRPKTPTPLVDERQQKYLLGAREVAQFVNEHLNKGLALSSLNRRLPRGRLWVQQTQRTCGSGACSNAVLDDWTDGWRYIGPDVTHRSEALAAWVEWINSLAEVPLDVAGSPDSFWASIGADNYRRISNPSGVLDPSETAVRLARLLETAGLRQITQHFKAWSARAAHDPRQPAMFWTAPTRSQALDILERSPNPEGPSMANDSKPCCGSCAMGAPCSGGRRVNPEGELRAVIRPAGKSADVQLYAVCLAIVDGTKIKQVFSCSTPTKTALETAVAQAQRLAASQGLAVDVNGILLQEASKDSKARLSAVVVSKAKTSQELARDIVGQVHDLKRTHVVAKTPAGMVHVDFDARGKPAGARLDGRASKQLEKALTKDLAALNSDKETSR